MLTYYLTYSLTTINLHIEASHELALIATKKQRRISNIFDIADSSHGHVGNELRSVFWCIWQAHECREQSCTRQKRCNGIDTDLVWTILGRKTQCCLNMLARMNRKGLGRQGTFVTAPFDELYQTRPGRGRIEPVLETLMMLPPPCFFI